MTCIELSIALDEARKVSGLYLAASSPAACYVFAHGAGAGMNHPFMTEMAQGLAESGIATLRFQFPYMENGSKRPDPPRIAQAAVRAAVAKASRLAPGIPIFAGGKSFGGRMSSQAQASGALPGVAGLVFFGFPLHPPGKPGTERAEHLREVEAPMLFLQGTRDEFAQLPLLEEVCRGLGARATLHLVGEGDHSFRVPARAGRAPAEIKGDLVQTAANWMKRGPNAR